MGGLRINKISKALGAFTGNSADPVLTSNAVTGKVDTTVNSFSSLLDGNIWIGNASNIPVPRFITGDITINNLGVAAIAAGVIVNADISTSAGITFNKMIPMAAGMAVVTDVGGFIGTSSASAAQIAFLNTTTSDVQVQLDAKQGLITGAASSVVSINLTPNIVAVTDGAGKFTSSTTPVSALAFINTLTSDAQAQINTKLSVSLGVNTLGDLLYYNGSAWTNFPRGTAGQILTTTGSTIGWGSATANGLPVGGSNAQFLAKNSGVNYDASWFTLTLSLVTDVLATAAQLNASTTYLTTAGVPTGTNGQALTIVGGILGWTSVGTGTVTSVGVTGGTTGLTFSGSPVTTSGTMTMAGTLGVVNGGTAQTTVAIGDILYGSALNTWTRLAATTNGFVLTLQAGLPVWAAAGGGGSGWSTSGVTTITANTSQTGAFTNTFNLNSVVVTQNAQNGAVPSAFVINGGAHTGATSVTGLVVNASTGATNNYAAAFLGGRVGIGTASPISGLHIVTSVVQPSLVLEAPAGVVGVRLYKATATDISSFNFYTGDSVTGTRQFAISHDSTNTLAITTNTTTVGMFLTTAGNVGIGTTAPATILHVAGSSGTLPNLFLDNSTLSGSYIRYKALTGQWHVGTDAGGNGTSGNHFYIYNSDDAAYRLTIQRGTGRVGIGMAAPTATLHVQSATDSEILSLNGNTATASPFMSFRQNGVRKGVIQYVDAIGMNFNADGATSITLNTNNTARLTVLGLNGEVGIGTTNPLTKLHISGANADLLRLEHNSGNAQLSFYTAGVQAGYISATSASGFQSLTLNAFTPGLIYMNTGGNVKFHLDQTGSVRFYSYGGSGTTTATLNTNGTLGRTTALSFDGSDNVLLNNSVFLNNNLFINSDIFFTNGVNIFTGLVSGTMFGTSDLQKLSFFGQIPDRQPDTGITGISKLTFGGSPIGENDTIGGYTMGQVVAALKQLGLLQ